MSTPSVLDAVSVDIVVAAPPERAFAVFVEQHDSWWPREYHIGTTEVDRVVIEPREGGRWFEVGRDGRECDWGRVLAFEPPRRLVLAWQISAGWAYDPELVTEVEVRFVPEGDGRTRVELEHRGLERMGERAAEVRAIFSSPNGWPGIMARYAALA